jgi:hypothetical protein
VVDFYNLDHYDPWSRYNFGFIVGSYQPVALNARPLLKLGCFHPGLKAPFFLCADGTVSPTNYRLISGTTSTGTANIDPLSSLAVAVAAKANNPAKGVGSTVPKAIDRAALDKAVADLMAMLEPLLDAHYASGTDPIRILTREKVDAASQIERCFGTRGEGLRLF